MIIFVFSFYVMNGFVFVVDYFEWVCSLIVVNGLVCLLWVFDYLVGV